MRGIWKGKPATCTAPQSLPLCPWAGSTRTQTSFTKGRCTLYFSRSFLLCHPPEPWDNPAWLAERGGPSPLCRCSDTEKGALVQGRMMSMAARVSNSRPASFPLHTRPQHNKASPARHEGALGPLHRETSGFPKALRTNAVIHAFTLPSLRPPIYLSIFLLVSPSLSLSIFPSLCPSLHSSIRQFIHPENTLSLVMLPAPCKTRVRAPAL